MQTAFDDPNYDHKLHNLAEKETPKGYSWPDTDENMMALFAGMAALGILTVFFSFSGLKTEDHSIALFSVSAVAASSGYFWRRYDKDAWVKRVDSRYWELKSTAKRSLDGSQ
jgi:hypothetical protein